MLAVILAAALLSLSPLIRAANSPLGCFTLAGQSYPDSTSDAESSDACACIGKYPYSATTIINSIFGPIDGTQFNCQCAPASAQPVTGQTQALSIAGNPKVCANSNRFSFQRLRTSFDFTGCFTTVVAASTRTPADGTTCFDQCDSAATIAINTGSACRCVILTAAEVTCGPNTFFTFARSAAATASGALRRDARMARRAAQQALETPLLCPSDHQACAIPGSDSYEVSALLSVLSVADQQCVDITSELESCGGCMYGVFGGNATATAGVDCSVLPGAPMGSYSCSAGQCKASACDRGYELDAAGMCV